ncbi:isoprenylcysteine carboxyl methyltransferase family protein [Phreatobacter stygius]|uniref:Isoprenylcysteine carboxyl methyltransferase n=1 Tax=Phreatobacter stygius TaxID=1940610 RepID=A0A4D7B010_9HYPH|nr:isoprenylcysteine carboxylmethyltransferase family protein [Phreatobacter stygius]QCI66949.1 hypothetical protein E8M01_23515 [Phreatobacter stygius]
MTLNLVILALVTAARAAELLLARRNTIRLIRRGAVEFGAGHYPLVVALHAAWLGGLWLLARDQPIQPIWLVLFALLQVGRVWVLMTLGERWTTRIIVEPARPLIRTGPYRFLAHPNYAVVAGEIAVLPLAFALVCYAAAFSVLNAMILAIRIRAENAALNRPVG